MGLHDQYLYLQEGKQKRSVPISKVMREAQRLCPTESRKIGLELHISLTSGQLRNRYSRDAVRLLTDLNEIFGRSKALPEAIVLWLTAITVVREKGESIEAIARLIHDRRIEILHFMPLRERHNAV